MYVWAPIGRGCYSVARGSHSNSQGCVRGQNAVNGLLRSASQQSKCSKSTFCNGRSKLVPGNEWVRGFLKVGFRGGALHAICKREDARMREDGSSAFPSGQRSISALQCGQWSNGQKLLVKILTAYAALTMVHIGMTVPRVFGTRLVVGMRLAYSISVSLCS